MYRFSVLLVTAALLACHVSAQPQRPGRTGGAEEFDTTAINKIIEEGTTRSKVMDHLSWLTDVYGPRLTGSPGYRQAAEWARSTLSSWGMQNAHLESCGMFGRGWSLRRYSASLMGNQVSPLLSYPKAWSPGTSGAVVGDVVYFDAQTDSALATFRGKLKGKFILIGDPVTMKDPFLPDAARESDSTLLAMANASPRRERFRRPDASPERRLRAMMEWRKLAMCQEEKALAILTPSKGRDGTIFVQGATVPEHPDTPYTKRARVYDARAPKILPQVAVAAEHYNRMVRMLQKSQPVKIEMNLQVEFAEPDSLYNVVAEIPGSDLKDEIVMVGGHLDSWHSGTGATDDGTGVSTAMEAMRIIKALGLKPRRTIRIGLWAGEEQGLLGSRGYVNRHFAERDESAGRGTGGFMRSFEGRPDSGSGITLKPEYDKFSVYFNNDNGTGRIRGIYLQGNEALRPVFRSWLAPFRSMGAETITALNTGGTDHLSFAGVGLPAFQFIQDEIEYDTRTWHSTMDVYDRGIEDDLKQVATIMAAFVYNAAMRDEKLPRR